MRKYAKNAGADQKTPSIPQYFSWINNTNEGSTEEQTLINLDFFRRMKETYGMQISIYAWDAGNFDGASEGYGDPDGEKFRSQYPEEYVNVVKKAESLGIRMGLWGSPDGYGDDEETQKERFDFFIHLCRDHHFALFKLDGVCGRLRKEKAEVFARMLRECRKYSPDLIVLNHRLELYEAEKYVTTFLWNGEETYTDVFTHNQITAMHSRAYLFSRGHVDKLARLAEDHGVCLSSALDYFEDELIYQAFSRSLILAPEIYGNPWFLRDDEYPKLARVFNLHRRNAPLLVDGARLPESFGPSAVSRGDGGRRFICTGNDTWETTAIEIPLDERIGLTEKGEYLVNQHHPFEKQLGTFSYGDTVTIEALPFRAYLIEISTPGRAEPMLLDCEYEMIIEDEDGTPKEVRLIKYGGGEIALLRGGVTTPFMKAEKIDESEKPPVRLGGLDSVTRDPDNGEELYEAAVFAADNDSLEARCIKRSGDSGIPEVIAAREAFFAQKTYRLRGCEAKNMFDGDPDTFYDSQSKTYCGGFRIDGGCLRVDLGETLDADRVEISCFAADEETQEVRNQCVPALADSSADLKSWAPAPLSELRTDAKTVAEVVKFCVHTTYELPGRMITAVYALSAPLRYLRIAEPMDRIYSVRFFKGDKELRPASPRANDLQAHYSRRKTAFVKSGGIKVPRCEAGSYLALAVNGRHGVEGVYACLECGGEKRGFPRRAPDYRANVWEHRVCSEGENNTFYYPLDEDTMGRTLTVHAVFSGGDPEEIDCEVWLCGPHR